MAAKQLAFEEEARSKLLVGVEKLARAVKATLGPRGKTAVLDKGWGAPTVTKDGVTVAEEIELSDLLEDVMITAQGLMAEKSIELRSEFPPDLPVIESDYTRVKQILDNLVGNAIKFTSEGYVAVRAIPIEDKPIVRVEVEDTGCGISPETLESIFELFKQVDGSLAKKFGGTGLGLAIVSRIISDHNGFIRVEDNKPKGTKFIVELPVSS